MKFINNTIIPFFLSKRRGNDKRNEVSKEKMTSLWLQRRKKAISVIGNNGNWPNIENVLISVQRNEDYYAQSSKCADSNGFEGVVPRFFDREEALASWYYGHFFSYDEIESTVKGCPSGKSCGANGVTYEDIKEMFSENWYVFVNILNIVLVNLRIPTSWEKSIVQRIPKKNFSINDLSMLRVVSLLPTCYKVFLKAICKRITPHISNEIDFWQPAFLYTIVTLSALLFILVIDRVCNPMVRETVIRQGIEDERRINPCPLQAFADDVVVVSYDVTIMNEMFDIGQVAMKIAGLEGKPSKCAVMYAKRSRNNWYKGKADKKPTVSI